MESQPEHTPEQDKVTVSADEQVSSEQTEEKSPIVDSPSPNSEPRPKNLFSETCYVCETNKGKYRCPRCEIVTCSLECSKQHKKQRQCSGKRKRSHYVPLMIMDEHDLVNDLCLLEDAKRIKLTASSTTVKEKVTIPKGLPKKTRQLLQEARQFNITITLLPSFMQRHKENTTSYDFKRLMILWRLELVFHSAGGFTITLPSVEDVKSLSELMSELLRKTAQPLEINPQMAAGRHKHLLSSVTNIAAASSGDTSLADVVKDVYPSSTSEWCYFMRHCRCPANNPLYYRLSPSDSLRSALQYKEVIEFPTIIVSATPDEFPLFTQEKYEEIQEKMKKENEEWEKRQKEREEAADEAANEQLAAELEVLKQIHNLPVLNSLDDYTEISL